MTPRKELLDFFATRELRAVEPRAEYQPPFEGPVIGFSGVERTPTPRGGEDDFIAAMREIDCGDCDCEYCRPPQPVTWEAADVRAAYVLGLVSGVIMTALFIRAW